MPLQNFHPFVRAWFESHLGSPTPPQTQGWPAIQNGEHALILAPTGSGKTLAAFLWAIDRLVRTEEKGLRVVYVSPLKALSNDIERNLHVPLEGIAQVALSHGLELPAIRTTVRTGDTPAATRRAVLEDPPEILITTPESLYILLTSRARGLFGNVHTVIVDEIHSMAGTKRGVHLALTLERLECLTARPFQRIGLSATQRPLDEIARLLGGLDGQRRPRPVTIVDVGGRKRIDLKVVCAANDFAALPESSIWPLVFPEVYTLVVAHRTTLVFTNSRRLSERVAGHLNEIAGYVLALAYHGSMSPEVRRDMEERLKAGGIRCLVATSALELGIDIGSIDLVIQLQSPKGIARGLQRVGRSGHLVAATSQGRVFPTFRGDLVESSVIAREMLEGRVEHTVVPRECLDVLAQQIVAAVSMDDWDVDELYAVVRQAYPYTSLSRDAFLSAVRMVAGRYNEEEFRQLRARISWDPTANRLRKLPGSQLLAITSGGTIPDRGLFGAYLENGKRIGELDEEFIYESRVGDVFILGSSAWRIDEIGLDRVMVSPSRGDVARMPFWKGEGIGRDFELSLQVGEFRRTVSNLDPANSAAWIEQNYPVDSRTARNIAEYVRKQKTATQSVPDDRTILAEIFRDEIDNPRLAVHSVFGKRVNGLLAMALESRLRQILRVNVPYLEHDEGILFQIPDAEIVLDPESARRLFSELDPARSREWIAEEIARTPLFIGAFRENAMRALMLPRNKPGRRTPLWLQRLRAGNVLEIIRRFDDFPLVVETIRDCLYDRLDFNSFRDVLERIRDGRISVQAVRTETPSPFASTLLFSFIAVYMYEGDSPRAEGHPGLLGVAPALLDEVLHAGPRRARIRPQAVEQLERRLQFRDPALRARSAEELAEILHQLGELTDEELRSRSRDPAFVADLERRGRIVPFHGRFILYEDREAYGPGEPAAEKSRLRRFLEARGPVQTSVIQAAFEFDVRPGLAALEGEGAVVRGSFLSDAEEWCHAVNLEQLYRRTFAVLRREIRTCSIAEYTAFLLDWQGRSGAARPLEDVLAQLEGYPAHADVWESHILAFRVHKFERSQLDRLVGSGKVFALGSGSGRARFMKRGRGWLLITEPTSEDISEAALQVLAFLKQNGASFFEDLREGLDLKLSALVSALSELFWSGEITNDVWAEIARLKRFAPADEEEIVDHRRKLRAFRRAWRDLPGWTGRWSLIRSRGWIGKPGSPDERAQEIVRLILRRYGVAVHEWFGREQWPVPWPIAAAVLERMEWRGEIRRGYFIEELSGIQYALPEAVERLQFARSHAHDFSGWLNACDPANPYGGGIPSELRVSRHPSMEVRLDGGRPVEVRRR